jgi:hypothetical protein
MTCSCTPLIYENRCRFPFPESDDKKWPMFVKKMLIFGRDRRYDPTAIFNGFNDMIKKPVAVADAEPAVKRFIADKRNRPFLRSARQRVKEQQQPLLFNEEISPSLAKTNRSPPGLIPEIYPSRPLSRPDRSCRSLCHCPSFAIATFI